MNLRKQIGQATIACGALALASPASAQARYFFSVNFHGPTIGSPDPISGTAITEGDILRPFNSTSLPVLTPATGPNISYTHTAGGLGLPGGCIGHPAGTPCIVEVDAFSRGGDNPFSNMAEIEAGDILFSVDEFARGTGFGPMPNVRSEAIAREAAPDAFTNLGGYSPGPIPPSPGRNVGMIDGDGLPSASGYTYPGTGIIEPNTPFGGLPDTGDNKDAMDLVQASIPIFGPYYFSLDSAFFDPLESAPNSGSAAANGFNGGDILTNLGGTPGVFAPSFALGLDIVAGPDTDDLDALILFENGSLAYEPSMTPYDWLSGATDMVVFSVRRGSAVIGMPDSIFGLPIEEGDLLIPPPAGGVSPLPGIFIAAENLGLQTRRSGVANFGDDITALDSLRDLMYDCDGDNIEDAVAIAMGIVPDANMDGVPDSCQPCLPVGTPFCFCPNVVAPCGNPDSTAGCRNVAGTGALLTGCGSASVAADDLILTTSGMVPGTFALTFMGGSTILPANIGNGLLCVGGPLFRFPPYSTGSGTASIGAGLVNYTVLNNPPIGQITVSSTWNFTTFYRDIGGACGSNFNLSNALAVTFTP